jgi:hypothetical protein
MQTKLTAVAGPVERNVRPQRTEWTEVRLALRQEYGHPYTHKGVPCMDFSKHVYVGRAGALLLKAEKQEAALRELLACHTESAGWSMSMLADRAEFDAMLQRSQERFESAVGTARVVLGA